MGQMRIFVSHSHVDNDFGLRLVEDLRDALGGDHDAVWYDASGGLHGGDAWWRVIVTELTARPVFIVVLSPSSMRSPRVNDEIDLAWKQKNSAAGKAIVPVQLHHCQVREDVAMRHIISFVPPRPYEQALHELLTALGIREGRWQAARDSAQTQANRPVQSHVEPTVSIVGTSSITKFIDNDIAYLRWVDTHPHGFVLNSERRPRSSYLMLRRASCGTIKGTPTRKAALPGAYVWTGPYIKVCSDSRQAIENWAYSETRGAVKPCRICNP